MKTYEMIPFYENLVRQNFVKLFSEVTDNEQDKLFLDLAIACGSPQICDVLPILKKNKILRAHKRIYKAIDENFSTFKPILNPPYNHTSLHLVFRHNLLYFFATEDKVPLKEKRKKIQEVFTTKQQLLMAYEYYILVNTLHVARDRNQDNKIDDVLKYIRTRAFPLLDVPLSKSYEIHKKWNIVFNEYEYDNVVGLKKMFKKYSALSGYMFSYYFMVYVIHKSIVLYPTVFEGAYEILPYLKSVHLDSAKYLLSYMYNLPKETIPNFFGNINYKRYYYL